MSAKYAAEITVGASPIHGTGVFAAATLPGRKKLGTLSGALVRLPQAWTTVEGQPVIYMIELSRRYALDCSEGNSFKHLNHSCTPNCYLRIYRRTVEVYTLKAIEPGAELTVDYGETPHKGGMTCHCGAPRCKRAL
jgi:hypothetical protein